MMMGKKVLKMMVLSMVVLMSCTDNDDNLDPDLLSTVIIDREIEEGGVIACAASDKDDKEEISVFFYPKEGTSDFRLYETTDETVDKSNYSNYRIVKDTTITKVFNGHLEKFIEVYDQEKWVIVTFEFEKVLRISNPIRIKNITQRTLYSEEVTINQTTTAKPIFTWPANPTGNTEIYFQVISNTNNNLLSGTYTNENTFQYYETGNVVLNVTTATPPNLTVGDTYNFTLMDVSEDNWVNVVTEKSFVVE